MPTAIRIIDRVAEMVDWNQSTFLDGMLAQWDATSGKFIGSFTTTLSNIIVPGIDASSLSTAGLAGYISANNVLTKTDSLSYNSSLIFGFTTQAGSDVAIVGLIDAQFTTVGGLPPPGAAVWLAASTDESGAAGKLTATPPTTGVIAEVGICVDNSNYTSSKKSKILFRSRTPIIL